MLVVGRGEGVGLGKGTRLTDGGHGWDCHLMGVATGARNRGGHGGQNETYSSVVRTTDRAL